MLRGNSLDIHLEESGQSASFRKGFSTRLDMTIKRARITSRLVAIHVGVKEREVDFWRAGITVPHGAQCHRLSQLLRVDLSWLCLAAVPVVREYERCAS